MAIEIVDLPLKMVHLSIVMLVYQRVYSSGPVLRIASQTVYELGYISYVGF